MPPAVTVLPDWLPRAAGASLLLLLASLAALVPAPAHAIGCFVCSSVNGSNPDCEDTFNNTGRFYQSECRAGRKQRSGLFPGTECIKMKAERDNYTVIVRSCAVDNGDLTSDTEMGRESHCWWVNRVKYEDVDMVGCTVACRTDGCNHASPTVRAAGMSGVMVGAAVSLLWTTGPFGRSVL